MSNTKNILKVGIVGLGFGATVHLPVFKSIKGVKVIAIADKNLSQAEKIAKKEKIGKIFKDFRELLREDLDVVSFALPPKENEVACQVAIKKKIAIFSEKQIATSSIVAAELAEKAKNLTCGLDFEFQELKVFKKLKEIIVKEALGKVRYVQIAWLLESFYQKEKIWSWKTDFSLGGGVVPLFGSHILYLIEWLFGKIERIFAMRSSKITKSFAPRNKKAGEEFVVFIAQNYQDIPISVTISNASPGKNLHRWEVVFDEGTLVLENKEKDYMTGFSLVLRKNQKEYLILKEFKNPPVCDGRFFSVKAMLERFLKAVSKNQEFSPNFKNGARVQGLIEAIYQSDKEKHWIKV